MTRHLSTVFAVIMLLLSIDSARADSTSSTPQNTTGCYEVSQMLWDPAPGEDIKYLIIPKRIWLTSTRAFRDGTYLLLPAPGQPQTFHNNTYWEMNPKEGIVLKWAAGPTQVGLRIILQPPSEPDKPMTGVAKAGFDTPKPYKDIPVEVTKVPCKIDFPE